MINPIRDNSRSMYFKDENGDKQNLRPVRISYIYYDEEYQFRSVAFFNQRLFMQILKEDTRLSYYNYIHKRDNSIASTKVAIKSDGEALEISALTFKRQMTDFIEDCPSLALKVENRVYRYKDYEQIFADYNQCDVQVYVSANSETSTSAQNQGSNTTATTAIATGTSATTTPTTPDPETGTGNADNLTSPQDSEGKKAKLSEIDSFRSYVRGLENFENSRDVLEWLTDVEYRIIENRNIPNYLWSSLDEMSENHAALKQKSEALKLALQN